MLRIVVALFLGVAGPSYSNEVEVSCAEVGKKILTRYVDRVNDAAIHLQSLKRGDTTAALEKLPSVLHAYLQIQDFLKDLAEFHDPHITSGNLDAARAELT